jgi:preprotein translocase subunit SecG
MITVILIIHLLLAITMVGSILLQRSEGGALGIGGSGGGMAGFMTGRSTANMLTRTTAILATAFFVTSLVLALLTEGTSTKRSIMDVPAPASSESVPAAPATPAAPPAPAAPSVPLSQ